MSKCTICGKEVESEASLHRLIKNKPDGTKIDAYVCDDCYHRFKQARDRQNSTVTTNKPNSTPYTTTQPAPVKKTRHEFSEMKVLIWSIVFGALTLIGALIACLINKDKLGTAATVLIPIIGGYAVLAEIYCIFTASWISDVFFEVASWSIKMPGIIFSFDLDGFLFLIGMKLLFAVLGFLIGIAVAILATGLSTLLSVFTFPFLVIYHKHN